jgi:hypothetical protein
MSWGKSTKQRKSARRRSWAQHLRSLPDFQEKYLRILRCPPELMRLTKAEQEWARSVITKHEKGLA